MKLYATITSERATKGQGGKYLNIEVSDTSGIMFFVDIIPSEDGMTATIHPIGNIAGGKVLKLYRGIDEPDVVDHEWSDTEKAKRQKGKIGKCNSCGRETLHYAKENSFTFYYCDYCET